MEEIKKIEVAGQQYGVADMLMRSVMGGNAQVIAWSHTHNMNDYKDAGTYRIKGERTGNPMSDNLPIMNSGSGHTIEGILYVLDSSLTNGSGNSDDCTITQFLMLSNRVGGQEGDMYMRSAYGATKDSLTWKSWEKYQTNMEVGCVSDYKLLNPNNPTQVLKNEAGLAYLTDNGIYSGVYIGPKAMIGTQTTEYIEFQDPTGIETFVMVVINNYAAAGDAKTITQIKFAVTNGGVFSMEKRNVTLGTALPQWESVGGGLPASVSFDLSSPNNKYYFGYSNAVDPSLLIGSGVAVGDGVQIGRHVKIGDNISMNTLPAEDGKPRGVVINTVDSWIGKNASIGQDIFINDGVVLEYFNGELSLTGYSYDNDDRGPRITTTGSDFNFFYGWMQGPAALEGKYYGQTTLNAEFGYVKFESSNGNKSIEIRDGGLLISTDEPSNISIKKNVHIGENIVIPDNLQFSIADNILTITDGTNTWKLTAESTTE